MLGECQYRPHFTRKAMSILCLVMCICVSGAGVFLCMQGRSALPHEEVWRLRRCTTATRRWGSGRAPASARACSSPTQICCTAASCPCTASLPTSWPTCAMSLWTRGTTTGAWARAGASWSTSMREETKASQCGSCAHAFACPCMCILPHSIIGKSMFTSAGLR